LGLAIRRMIFSVLVCGALCNMGGPLVKAAELRVEAKAAILMDAQTGQVYYAHNAEQRNLPASLTKLMTAILAAENAKPGEVAVVSKKAAKVTIGSTINLDQGDRITMGNLLKAALITSANDSTVAIAEQVAGSEEAFLYEMNRKAFLIGALNTRYANTNGYYDPRHYTTAYDLAVIARYALANPRINSLVRMKGTTVRWINPAEREKKITNTNRLLKDEQTPGVDGVKTGSTPRAGDCLIASATRGERRLIAVVLHAKDRYETAAKMLEYGFNQVGPVVIFPAGGEMGRVQVNDGTAAFVTATVAEPVLVNIARDQLQDIKLRTTLGDNLPAPVRKGQMLGQADFTVQGYPLAKVPLVAAADVPPQNLLARLLFKIFK